MTRRFASGVVVDTMIVSWLLERPSIPLADQYRELIGTAPVLLAFQTVAELRFGAIRAGWGELRRRRLERSIGEFSVVYPDDHTLTTWAQLRADCQRLGHALGDKVHDSDRWIAASALRLQRPLVSHDGLFEHTPGLKVISLAKP